MNYLFPTIKFNLHVKKTEEEIIDILKQHTYPYNKSIKSAIHFEGIIDENSFAFTRYQSVRPKLCKPQFNGTVKNKTIEILIKPLYFTIFLIEVLLFFLVSSLSVELINYFYTGNNSRYNVDFTLSFIFLAFIFFIYFTHFIETKRLESSFMIIFSNADGEPSIVKGENKYD